MILRYGDKDFADYHFRLISIEDEMLPNHINETIRNPSGVGEIITRKIIDARWIRLTGRIIAASKEVLNHRTRKLAAMLSEVNEKKDGSNRLYLPDREHYYYAALTGRSPLMPIMRSADVEIEFYCADPLAYGLVRTMEIPDTLTVLCDYFVLPIITVEFDGAVSGYTVTDSKSGDHVEVQHNFVANDKLIIDCENESVKLNGTLIMNEVTYASDFLKLYTGENELTSTSPATISYQERWLYA